MSYITETACKHHKLKTLHGYKIKINTVFSLAEAISILNKENDIKVANTLAYIYKYTAGGGILCNITQGKCTWTALYNKEYVNSINIKMTQREIYTYIKTKNKVLGFVPNAKLLDKKHWTNNGCLINMYDYNSIFNSYTYELIDMIEYSIKNQLINTKFILWLKDFPIMTKKGKYIPIFSQSMSPGFYDICIPNNEEWSMITRKFYPEICRFPDINAIISVQWSSKIEKGFFRGSGTGCISNNPRIAISYLTDIHPDLLDAGIIKFTHRDRLENGKLLFMNPKNFGFKLLPEVPMYTWSMYKYVINIKGNGAAYRLPFLFYLGSVILIVKSKFFLWFEPLLTDYHDYISINEDLSNLIEVINWCKNNDDKCKQIALNGRAFADKWFNKESISYYLNILLKHHQ